MDLLTGALIVLVAAIAGFLGNIAGNIVASEIYDRTPSIAVWLLAKTVARLPESERDRYQEELLAHLEEYPGKVGKLLHALGVYFKAAKLASELAHRPRMSTRTQTAQRVERRVPASRISESTGTETHTRLTPREREILQWVAIGKTDEEIADILSISTMTVTSHVENAKQKLDAFRRTYAVVQAIRRGEIDL